jgi:hypothetical protein
VLKRGTGTSQKKIKKIIFSVFFAFHHYIITDFYSVVIVTEITSLKTTKRKKYHVGSNQRG